MSATCPACAFDNPEGHRFCGGCGASLAGACPGCGAENPVGHRFCGQCGAALAVTAVPERAPRDYTPKHLAERILQSKSALEGERKQVTVLFADVKGSVELAEGLDPEEWHGILERFFQILADGVHRFEGTVNQYTGDGIMALFGAPVAHEDHAQRACFAALHLRGALRDYADALRLERGLSFSVRMGMNSGEVVVGRIGDDLRMDYTAQGHTVGLAARMQQIAESGKALLTADTEKQVAGYFALRDLGAARIKGLEEPVAVYELEGPGPLRTRFDLSRRRGLSKFVGRDREMEALEAALERAIAGEGSVVGLVGDAGVGKSRLCFELAERARVRGIAVRQGQGVAHGRAVPLLPVLEFYREAVGIRADDTPLEARQKIAGAAVLLDDTLREDIPLLFDFLGVPDPERPVPELAPEARERRLLELLRRITAARSRREAAVILFEDLHWLDPATERFIEMLVDACEGSRSLLLVNFRPEFRADWMGRPIYQQIPLRPLDADALRALLESWLGSDPSLAELPGRILERTAGNPFFVEEVVQSLIESGALEGSRGAYRLTGASQEVEIPASVHALLAARIDRLPEREKQLLQAASAIGVELPEPLLAAVSDLPPEALAAAVRGLVQREHLYEAALFPERELAFKHPLTQEVAHGSLLRPARAGLHAAVARAIEERAGDAVDEQAALLAHHWEQAEEPFEAARWHARAGDRAGYLQLTDLVTHWQRARALLSDLPSSAEAAGLVARARTALLFAGARIGIAEEEQEELLRESQEDFRKTGDRGAESGFLVMYAAARLYSGHRSEAQRIARGVLADFATDLDPGHAQMAYFLLLAAAMGAADNREALEIWHDAEPHLQGNEDLRPFGLAVVPAILFIAAPAHEMAGRLEEGGRLRERLHALAEGSDDHLMKLLGVQSRAIDAARRGDAERAIAAARRSIEMAELETGSQANRVAVRFNFGAALSMLDRFEEAESVLEDALRVGRDAGVFPVSEERLEAMRAQSLVAAGRCAAARESIEAMPGAEDPGGSRLHPIARHVLARAWIGTEGLVAGERASALLDQCERSARERLALVELPWIAEARAALAEARGDAEERERQLAEAERLSVETGNASWVERFARMRST
jgi:class 3 adenylate cyclase/tetratricopeptide (TPR) repeat protein